MNLVNPVHIYRTIILRLRLRDNIYIYIYIYIIPDDVISKLSFGRARARNIYILRARPDVITSAIIMYLPRHPARRYVPGGVVDET